jgi:hypothetical protein
VFVVSWYAGQGALVYQCADTRSENVQLFSPSGKAALEEVRETVFVVMIENKCGI